MPENVVTTPVQRRLVSPDVLRVVAVLSVISIHFFLYSGFYELPINNVSMMIMLVMRLCVSSCVPLFIILTGYLSLNKKLCKQHYAKGMKVVWLYLLATIPMIIYRVYIKHNMKLPDALWGILRFNATTPYGWYVEMYLGLYLMIPFLNILYKNIPSRNWKRVLIVSCIALNSLPKIINVYNFLRTGWWDNPSSSTDYQRLIPQWWLFGYPLTYYFIGCYLREYGLAIGKVTRRLLFVVTIFATTLYMLWRAPEGKFAWGPWIDWDSPLVLLSGTLLASLLLDHEYRWLPGGVVKVLAYLSGMSLQIFILSYIFDTEYYPLLKQWVPQMNDRLWAFFLIVPAIFLSSVAVAAVTDLMYRLFGRLYRLIKNKIKLAVDAKKAAAAEPEIEPNTNENSQEET